MRLVKQLTVGKQTLPLCDYRLVLELSSGGRGVFETTGEVTLGRQ
ncbi:hypothetical protein [Shewanella marina]|nr:hypothetical protein [Shewanella marina]